MSVHYLHVCWFAKGLEEGLPYDENLVYFVQYPKELTLSCRAQWQILR